MRARFIDNVKHNEYLNRYVYEAKQQTADLPWNFLS